MCSAPVALRSAMRSQARLIFRSIDMPADNPYTSPLPTKHVANKPLLLLWSFGAVFASALVGGVLGLLMGAALGSMMPAYYRSVFAGGDSPNFDPVAVGIGQGLTQGVVFGGVVGLALVAMYYWYLLTCQRNADHKSSSQ